MFQQPVLKRLRQNVLRNNPSSRRRNIKTYPVSQQAEVTILDHPRDYARAKIARVDAERPFSPMLTDSFNRPHNYLRISLTERCNLRCFYCMPSEGVELSPRDHILTDDEIIRLATLFVQNGVTKIRLTGGEPTIRKDLIDIVARLNELRQFGLKSIGLTSNGLALHRKLPALVENGLTHLNISLDTLDPFKFEIMTRRMGHDAVVRALDAALSTPTLQSVKLNVVIVKGLNDNEILDFLELTRTRELSVRFIEFMPFTGNKWDKAKMIPSSELLSRIRAKHPDVIKVADELNDTAQSYLIPGYAGSFGFISSMSDHFCASCNRLRLTADGQIKVCLFDAKEISLRDQMRQGADDAILAQTIARAVRGKQEKHVSMEDIDVTTNRPMILIGATNSAFVANFENFGPTSITRHLVNTRFPFPSQFHTPARYYSSRPSRDATSRTPKLTHIDASGRASMVDVSAKEPTKRTATASGRIYIPKVAYELIVDGATKKRDRTSGAESTSVLETAKAKARSKGDVLTVAQLAAVMGCKRTAELIPLCHPLQLSHIAVTLHPEMRQNIPNTQNATHDIDGAASDVGTPLKGSPTRGDQRLQYSIICRATVSCEGKTGVEMEALTAVSVGLLTVWDMLKAIAGKEMTIGDIVVDRKDGGKSGDFVRVQVP